MPESRPVRVPEEIHAPLRAVAALMGKTPGEVLASAFSEYCQIHKEELSTIFGHAQKLISNGDVTGLVDLTADSRRERAERAAAAARGRSVKGRPSSP